MPKILINDGMDAIGIQMLKDAGIEIQTEKIAQEDLPNRLNEFDGICVRSATKVRKELIDLCPNLKFIGRGGVGMDNIDVAYAREKGIVVENTPAASSRTVAELVFAHLLSLARFTHQSNREMPLKGNTEFDQLKKSYAGGFELLGKKIGIIGLGKIGQETAKIAINMGMEVIPVDIYIPEVTIDLSTKYFSAKTTIKTVSLEDMLPNADIISLHIPSIGKAILGAEQFAMMKDSVVLINAARGGTIDEIELLKALESGKIRCCGLDVFENEPTPNIALLTHDKISCSPHIGASTFEAQENVSKELASKIIAIFKK